MMPFDRNFNHVFPALSCSIFLALCASIAPVFAQTVVLHLKGGDQISGRVVSESINQVVISNVWVKALSIPLSEVSSRETNKIVTASAPPHPVAQQKPTVAALKPSLKAPSKTKGTWHGQINIGTSVIVNQTEQQDYSAQAKFVYTKPYRGQPKKFFRNTTELGGEYQRTDGQTSANHAALDNKSDFDLWSRYYAYGQAGAGYDRVQNIDFQYQVGPGGGVHLINRPHFVLNSEAGLTYQDQYNRNAPNLETVYARLAEDFTWEIWKNVKLTENEAFYPDLEHGGQYHNNFTSTLSYGFWNHFTLNLTVADHYNTQLSTGANPNEFDFRSSLGYKF